MLASGTIVLGGRMRRVTTTLALALFLLGCGVRTDANVESEAASAAPSRPVSVAPSGKPIGVVGYGINGEMPCQGQWADGSLRADVELENRITGTSQGPIALEVWPLDKVEWPPGVEPVRLMAVRWPLEYTGVRLADGEVAVLDGAGHLVAATGRNYRLKGEWAVIGAIGGPLFGEPPWIDAFNVCRGDGSVIPQ